MDKISFEMVEGQQDEKNSEPVELSQETSRRPVETEKTRRDRLSQVLFFQSRKFCSRITKKKKKKTLAKKSLECEQ